MTLFLCSKTQSSVTIVFLSSNREVPQKKWSKHHLRPNKRTRRQRAQTWCLLRCSVSRRLGLLWHRQFRSLCFLVAAHCHHRKWRRRKRRLLWHGLLLKNSQATLKLKALAKVWALPLSIRTWEQSSYRNMKAYVPCVMKALNLKVSCLRSLKRKMIV